MRKNNKRDWDFVYDFYWADNSVESARSETIRNKSEVFSEIDKIIEKDSELNFILFEKFGPEHPISQLWLESETDLKASIYLAFGGYYRQAIAILRNWLELTLLAIYYSNHWKEYKLWKQKEYQAPIGKSLIKKVFDNKGLELQDKCENLYSLLSGFSHTQGIDKYQLQKGRDNVPRYLDKPFDLWFTLLKKSSMMNACLLQFFFKKELKNAIIKKSNKRV